MRRLTKSDWKQRAVDLAVIQSCARTMGFIVANDGTAVISVPAAMDRRRRNRVVRRALSLELDRTLVRCVQVV